MTYKFNIVNLNMISTKCLETKNHQMFYQNIIFHLTLFSTYRTSNKTPWHEPWHFPSPSLTSKSFMARSSWKPSLWTKKPMGILLGCPKKLVNWLVNGLFHLLINGIYWGYNPLIPTFDPNFQGHPSEPRNKTWLVGLCRELYYPVI